MFDELMKKKTKYLDVNHGSRFDDILNRHVGDLGNITTNASGTAIIQIEDSIIQLYNMKQSIVGRTIIVHQMFDDGGDGTGDRTDESRLTG